MKFTCKTCLCTFNRKLTLREKQDRYKPEFCEKDCAIAWRITEGKKNIKKKKVGVRMSSKEELVFGNIVKQFFPKLIPQYQVKGYDHYYDFYSPELNLILEYNGSYWHDKRGMRHKDKYHISEATKNGIYIAMIKDNEWKAFIKDGLPDRNALVKMLNSCIKNMEK